MCNDGWMGTECAIPTCDFNGVFNHATNTCICFPGYSGASCDMCPIAPSGKTIMCFSISASLAMIPIFVSLDMKTTYARLGFIPVNSTLSNGDYVDCRCNEASTSRRSYEGEESEDDEGDLQQQRQEQETDMRASRSKMLRPIDRVSQHASPAAHGKIKVPAVGIPPNPINTIGKTNRPKVARSTDDTSSNSSSSGLQTNGIDTLSAALTLYAEEVASFQYTSQVVSNAVTLLSDSSKSHDTFSALLMGFCGLIMVVVFIVAMCITWKSAYALASRSRLQGKRK
jgi:hypothetical protein